MLTYDIPIHVRNHPEVSGLVCATTPSRRLATSLSTSSSLGSMPQTRLKESSIGQVEIKPIWSYLDQLWIILNHHKSYTSWICVYLHDLVDICRHLLSNMSIILLWHGQLLALASACVCLSFDQATLQQLCGEVCRVRAQQAIHMMLLFPVDPVSCQGESAEGLRMLEVGPVGPWWPGGIPWDPVGPSWTLWVGHCPWMFMGIDVWKTEEKPVAN